jgi:hypothetical protein
MDPAYAAVVDGKADAENFLSRYASTQNGVRQMLTTLGDSDAAAENVAAYHVGQLRKAAKLDRDAAQTGTLDTSGLARVIDKNQLALREALGEGGWNALEDLRGFARDITPDYRATGANIPQSGNRVIAELRNQAARAAMGAVPGLGKFARSGMEAKAAIAEANRLEQLTKRTMTPYGGMDVPEEAPPQAQGAKPLPPRRARSVPSTSGGSPPPPGGPPPPPPPPGGGGGSPGGRPAGPSRMGGAPDDELPPSFFGGSSTPPPGPAGPSGTSSGRSRTMRTPSSARFEAVAPEDIGARPGEGAQAAADFMRRTFGGAGAPRPNGVEPPTLYPAGPAAAAAKGPLERLTDAYHALTAEQRGLSTVNIHDLQQRSGLPLPELHKLLAGLAKEGKVDLHGGTLGEGNAPELYGAGLRLPGFAQPFVSMRLNEPVGAPLAEALTRRPPSASAESPAQKLARALQAKKKD